MSQRHGPSSRQALPIRGRARNRGLYREASAAGNHIERAATYPAQCGRHGRVLRVE